MNARIKILSESNNVTRVTEVAGARMGDDLFISGVGHGQPGDVIEVPEFWVENFEGALAKKYYAE